MSPLVITETTQSGPKQRERSARQTWGRSPRQPSALRRLRWAPSPLERRLLSLPRRTCRRPCRRIGGRRRGGRRRLCTFGEWRRPSGVQGAIALGQTCWRAVRLVSHWTPLRSGLLVQHQRLVRSIPRVAHSPAIATRLRRPWLVQGTRLQVTLSTGPLGKYRAVLDRR